MRRGNLARAIPLAALLACAREARIEDTPDGPIDVSPEGRRARVRLPRAAPEAYPPILLVLHGYGANARRAVAYLGLERAADDAGVVLVLPEGMPDARGLQSWDAAGADDVEYLMSLADRAVARFHADPKRVWVLGHSNGGYMAHRLACAAATRFTAIASVVGARLAGTCDPAAPARLLEVHGTADESVLYEGGWVGRTTTPTAYLGAERAMREWAAANACAVMPAVEASEGVRTTRWSACRPGAAAELWTFEGAGHRLPLGPAFARTVLAFLASARDVPP